MIKKWLCVPVIVVVAAVGSSFGCSGGCGMDPPPAEMPPNPIPFSVLDFPSPFSSAVPIAPLLALSDVESVSPFVTLSVVVSVSLFVKLSDSPVDVLLEIVDFIKACNCPDNVWQEEIMSPTSPSDIDSAITK